jgi:pimeloyl-ACP methyl ester carboxylesterase
MTYGRKGLSNYSDLAESSPDYSLEDVEAIDKGAELSPPLLLPHLLNFDYTDVTRFDRPIFMFEGRYDLTTPSQVTAAWFKRIHVPRKGFVWFENSAHMIEVEDPAECCTIYSRTRGRWREKVSDDLCTHQGADRQTFAFEQIAVLIENVPA